MIWRAVIFRPSTPSPETTRVDIYQWRVYIFNLPSLVSCINIEAVNDLVILPIRTGGFSGMGSPVARFPTPLVRVVV
jgi:hypothetical protein